MAASEPRPSVRCVLVDLDDTLYRSEVIPATVKKNIADYMRSELGVSQEDVDALMMKTYLEYGTTMAGLRALGYDIDYEHWHEKVHGTLPYSELKRDSSLRGLLESIPAKKVLLTNADIKHTQKCLSILGVADIFQDIFCFERVMSLGEQHGLLSQECPVLCKPNKKVFELVLRHLGVDPAATVFMDDSIRNVASAHELGITTVIVGTDVAATGADLAIRTIHDLSHAMPHLFDGACHASVKPAAQRIELLVKA